MLKLLEPRQEKETKLSTAGICFYGFTRKQVLVDDQIVVSSNELCIVNPVLKNLPYV
jgi:hypothetical protein